MTDKQAVVDALERLPENASLDDIAEELQIMKAIRRGRAEVASGKTRPQAEVETMLQSWATTWASS